jgi:hypothetical protein
MKCNIGKTDRVLRIILGLSIASFGLLTQSWVGLIGLVLLATAALRWCPLYVPFKISTSE